MSNDNSDSRQETIALLKKAMEADGKIDQLKAELNAQLVIRSKALDEVQKKGIKRFDWQGLALTIFRKGEGLWSLRGKKNEEKEIFSID